MRNWYVLQRGPTLDTWHREQSVETNSRRWVLNCGSLVAFLRYFLCYALLSYTIQGRTSRARLDLCTLVWGSYLQSLCLLDSRSSRSEEANTLVGLCDWSEVSIFFLYHLGLRCSPQQAGDCLLVRGRLYLLPTGISLVAILYDTHRICVCGDVLRGSPSTSGSKFLAGSKSIINAALSEDLRQGRLSIVFLSLTHHTLFKVS